MPNRFEYEPPQKLEIKTRYQRMSLAMKIAARIEERTSERDTKEMAEAIVICLGAPISKVQGVLKTITGIRDLLADTVNEKARI